MTDQARKLLSDPRAPEDERYDAMSELQKATAPRSLSDLLMPREDLREVIDYIQNDFAEQDMNKALSRNVVPFPSKAAKGRKDGMQSVYIDDMQVNIQGDWFDKPGVLAFDSMRMMVDRMPILGAIIFRRIRQVQRFCRIQENGKGPGFEIRMREKDAHVSDEEKQSIQLLQDFFTNCGWEKNPRQRARLKRDDFSSLMSKLTRDSLTMDAAPIETEFKRDRKLGMDGIYAVDGATIRLCTEMGYRGDDEICALQVVQGQVRTTYTFDDLIYVPRNPRTDVSVGGYGLSEVELLVSVVTNLLNAMTYNGKYFDSNSIPKGLLHLSGQYSENDLAAFKRYWNAMVKGVNNAWTLPVMVSKDQESKASFEKFGVDVDEMMFAKWMTFLTSIACAIFGIDPAEINFESFSTKNSSLSGSDTEERLTSSHDDGLVPLLRYFENVFSDFIVADFSDKYVFRFTGLDEEDEKQKFEEDKLILRVNEMRAARGYDAVDDAWGEAPLNPSLLGAWQAEQQAGQEDFGTPGAPDGDAQPGQDDQGGGNDFGDGGEQDFGDGQPDDGGVPADPAGDPADFGKSFGLPIFKVEA